MSKFEHWSVKYRNQIDQAKNPVTREAPSKVAKGSGRKKGPFTVELEKANQKETEDKKETNSNSPSSFGSLHSHMSAPTGSENVQTNSSTPSSSQTSPSAQRVAEGIKQGIVQSGLTAQTLKSDPPPNRDND